MIHETFIKKAMTLFSYTFHIYIYKENINFIKKNEVTFKV